MLKPAVFCERDGVLNSLVLDEMRGVMDSPLSSHQLALCQQAGAFVRGLNERGYLVLVVTDQPAIAQGRLSAMGLDRIHAELRRQLGQAGGRIDGIFTCPHDPEGRLVRGARPVDEYIASCRCRRPAPGLILQAASTHKVDLARSFLVCRDLKGVRAGRSATVETILLTKAQMGEIEAPPDLRPHHVAVDLTAALRIIDASREVTIGS